MMVDKETIKKNFSRCAPGYDKHASVQKMVASQLIKLIKKRRFDNILDIGCGTGIYTKYLRERFPKAHIKAVDISPGMIDVACRKDELKGIEFVACDGETMDLTDSFDLITSSASFQWFTDLETALSRYRGALKKGGMMLFSTFGPLTFYELNQTLDDFFGKGAFTHSHTFDGRAKIENTLKTLFEDVAIEEKQYKEVYDSIKNLLMTIKLCGIRGKGISQRSVWVPETISGLEERYIRRFEGIVATYQAFFCRGEK
ncbi:MAG: malonyl-ACP O-methyltransferase BioC [Candidatus Omnitrophota bacterium]